MLDFVDGLVVSANAIAVLVHLVIPVWWSNYVLVLHTAAVVSILAYNQGQYKKGND